MVCLSHSQQTAASGQQNVLLLHASFNDFL